MIPLISLGPIDNNSFILTKGKESLLIDASPEPKRILKVIEAQNLKLKYILITHGHPDHTDSATILKQKTKAQIIAHEKDMELFQNPYRILSIDPKPFKPDILVKDNEKLDFGRIIHTPGHTQGSVCLYNKEDNQLFSGDTLFFQGIGRTDLPGGDFNQLIKSIKERLFTLPELTDVFPGHGENTTIMFEKEHFI